MILNFYLCSLKIVNLQQRSCEKLRSFGYKTHKDSIFDFVSTFLFLLDMDDTMRGINSEQESSLISLENIKDDKMFLLHFIIGTYFGPDLRKHHPKKQSAFQIQASNLPATDELSGSLIKRVELERVYHHVLKNADPSLVVKPTPLRKYFNGKRSDSKGDMNIPLFSDIFPPELHPESRLGNRHKLLKSIVFINDPDTSCMRGDCVSRFKRLTGLKSFALSLNTDVTETVSSVSLKVEDEIDVSLEPSKEDNAIMCADNNEENNVAGICVSGAISGAEAGPAMGLVDIGECADAYLFRIALPGVKRDESG